MDGLSLVMQTALGMVLLAVYHPLLLAFDVLLVLSMAVIVFLLGRGATPTAIKESKAKYAIAAWLEEIAAHTAAFKSASAAAYALGRVDVLAMEYLELRKAHFWVVLRQIAGSLALQAFASASLLGIGGFLVMRGQLTLGQLVAAELIVTTVVAGFSKFGKKLETYYDLLAALDKLGQMIDLPLEHSGRERPARIEGPAGVELIEVSLPAARGEPALSGVSLRVATGERLGVTGPLGAGKSALAGLLYGLRRPASGVILADGRDTRDLSLAELRDDAALVTDADVIWDTIGRNVSMGRSAVGPEEVYEALRQVGLLDAALALPEGLQTTITGGGAPLAGPQALLLVVARAIAGRPRLLIVDGVLDRIGDASVRDALLRVLFAPDAPWTLVCVTDRPEVLTLCNRVVRMEAGRIQEVVSA
jgi:ABC-type bacteriocin/lantibiotic exporter with double-glycine peptidase domain